MVKNGSHFVNAGINYVRERILRTQNQKALAAWLCFGSKGSCESCCHQSEQGNGRVKTFQFCFDSLNLICSWAIKMNMMTNRQLETFLSFSVRIDLFSLKAENVSLFTIILEPGILKLPNMYWIDEYTDLGDFRIELISEAKRFTMMTPG